MKVRLNKKKIHYTFYDVERDVSYFRGKKYYNTDGTQKFLVFKAVFSFFERSEASISSWKSTGVYDGNNVILSAVSNSSNLVPSLIIASENGKLNVTFSGNLSKQTKVAYKHGRLVNT